MTRPLSEGVSLPANPALSSRHQELPDEPLVVVQPSPSWSSFEFKELWQHRELLYFLTWRDLKVRYKQTIFGLSWVILQPVMMTVIFTLFLGKLVRVPTAGIPYPLLVFSGLVPWNFFSTSVVGASQSLVGNASLITKVYFPRVLIPASNVAGRLVDFAVSLSIFVGLMLFFLVMRGYHVNLSWKLLLLPLVILLLVVLTLSLAIFVSSLNVRYRDLGIALPVLMQLGMFASPVVYSQTIVPPRWQALYSINPLAGLIETFRAAIFDSPVPWFGLSITIAFSFVLMVGASLVFRATEKTFADVV